MLIFLLFPKTLQNKHTNKKGRIKMNIKITKDFNVIISDLSTPNQLVKLMMIINNLTANQLARQAGLSPMTVNAIVNGSQNITRNTSERLGNVFKLPPYALYKQQLSLKINALINELNQLEAA